MVPLSEKLKRPACTGRLAAARCPSSAAFSHTDPLATTNRQAARFALWQGLRLIVTAVGLIVSSCFTISAGADDALQDESTWQFYDAEQMTILLRGGLDQSGYPPVEIDRAGDQFVQLIESTDSDPLQALMESIRPLVPVVQQLDTVAQTSLTASADLLDPDSPQYALLEGLAKPLRMSVRTYLGRELILARLYDEALPVIAEVDAAESIDPAAVLFYRGACYHALLMKDEALADLRRLLENEDQLPRRFARTAKLMISDLAPLKEDSLDEVSRLMTDVTRRLELGRSDENVKKKEQEIIDKLSKLIEKAEEEQRRRQAMQQQGQGGKGGDASGKGAPAEESRAAGGPLGSGDVDRKRIENKDGWGNLPPADRQEQLQQISRELPTHYREAIEAYFRKLATEG